MGDHDLLSSIRARLAAICLNLLAEDCKLWPRA